MDSISLKGVFPNLNSQPGRSNEDGINLTISQVLLSIFDVIIEAIWPLTLMITVEEGEYPYDPFVMQGLANGAAFFVNLGLDYSRMRKFPSFSIGWPNFIQGAAAAMFYVTGLILLLTGFKSASSGAAAICGFLALPIFVLVVLTSAAVRNNTQEWHEVEMKLSGVTTELLLIITTSA